jgi:hypothetical protein
MSMRGPTSATVSADMMLPPLTSGHPVELPMLKPFQPSG